jgi:SRSO17 transposase
VYVRGLLGPGDRKSVEPLAARVAPGDYGQVHHFVNASTWDGAPLERVLAAKAQALVGGLDAVLIVDDTTLPKQGRYSVGVGRQYSGAVGKRANCQALVSLTLARGEVPVPVALRLFLPDEWTADPARCRAAGVPKDRISPRTKLEIALEEVDRVRAAGVTFGCVLADAGYGAAAEFRRALTARGLTWAVGITRAQTVYPADVALHWPRAATGRPRTHPAPTHPREAAGDVLTRTRWRRVSWRGGTKGPLAARFSAVRVVVADGPKAPRADHLPGDAAWLVGEYYLTNHAPTATMRQLAAAIKARWACEQAHQQLKEELGLDHFEGRTWRGLHHHALLTMISLAFLQHLRLAVNTTAGARGENPAAAERSAPTADPPGRAPRARRASAPRHAPVPNVPRAADLPAARARVDVAM